MARPVGYGADYSVYMRIARLTLHEKGADDDLEGFSDYSPKDDVDVIIPTGHFAKRDDRSLTLRDKPEAIRTMETYDG